MKYHLIILLCSYFLLASCSDSDSSSQQLSTSMVVAQAELISLQSVMISPPPIRRMWQYKIERLTPENTMVKKGDLIAIFDGQRLRTDLINRQSSLDTEIKKAESNKLTDEAKEQDLVLALAEAKMNYEKAQRKVEIVDTSLSIIEKQKQQADYKIKKARLDMAQQKLDYHRDAMTLNQEVSAARISMKKSRVEQLKSDMRKLRVVAPKDGLVIYQEDWNGKKPAIGEMIYMGQPVVEISSLNSMALKAEFSEPDTSRVALNQIVKVTFEAYPEKSYQGKVTSLGQSYRPKSNTNHKVVFDAIITLDELSDELSRPGMKAKVEVISS